MMDGCEQAYNKKCSCKQYLLYIPKLMKANVQVRPHKRRLEQAFVPSFADQGQTTPLLITVDQHCQSIVCDMAIWRTGRIL